MTVFSRWARWVSLTVVRGVFLATFAPEKTFALATRVAHLLTKPSRSLCDVSSGVRLRTGRGLAEG